MCGRYTRYHNAEAFAEVFGIDPEVELSPSYNVTPTQSVLAVRHTDKNKAPELTSFHWGLIPHWAKENAIGNKMINARSETVDEKPSFKSLFRARRCLIAADGWYEWQKTDSGKQPYYIHRHDKGIFFFAGLWTHWKESDQRTIESCTILTRPASTVLETIHNRMPVVIPVKAHMQWLNPDNRNTGELKMLVMEWAEDEFDSYPVSSSVNKSSNNNENCIKRNIV